MATTGIITVLKCSALKQWCELGYQVYQDIWDAALGEQVTCKREPGNHKDPFVRALVTVAGPAEAKLHWSSLPVVVPASACSVPGVHAEAREVWGYVPQENFLNLML